MANKLRLGGGGRGGHPYLGLSSRLQLLEFLGRGLDGRRRSEELGLGDDGGVLWVHTLGSCTGTSQNPRGAYRGRVLANPTSFSTE